MNTHLEPQPPPEVETMVSSHPELIIADKNLSVGASLFSRVPVYSSAWRGIFLVEPDIALLTAEVLSLTRSNYRVTPAFSQAEIFALRETKAIALAILSDHLGARILAAVAQTVRKQWPLARILIHGRPEPMLEDHLYDEEMSRSSDPKKLIEDVETLYKGSWNQRSHTFGLGCEALRPRRQSVIDSRERPNQVFNSEHN